jgi:hypothetical protein
MFTTLWSLGTAVALTWGSADAHPGGYLLAKTADAARAVPYVPREGDLIFYDDRSPVWNALFALAGSGAPLHMGIVVRRPGGTLAVLEAGPDDGLKVELRDAVPRLHQFYRTFGDGVTVRRCKVVLTPERSAALTKFAEAQAGKRYAVARLLLQGTPFRVRGPLEFMLGGTSLDRDAWICSEISVAAGTVAKLFDPAVVYANVAYPRDLVDNRRYDLSRTWEDAARWRPTPAGYSNSSATATRKPGN